MREIVFGDGAVEPVGAATLMESWHCRDFRLTKECRILFTLSTLAAGTSALR